MEPARSRIWDAPAERRPALRVVEGGGDGWASARDREMMEATSAALELVSAKWKVEVLFLLAAQVRRHGRLHDHLLISKKVLSDTLKSLVRDGLVSRTVYAEVPVRIEYALTPLGRSLTGPLFALYEWTDEHIAEVRAAREEHDGEAAVSDGLPRFTAAFQIRRS
jgi:DNA-binding HxlR family transcriptional regulator